MKWQGAIFRWIHCARGWRDPAVLGRIDNGHNQTGKHQAMPSAGNDIQAAINLIQLDRHQHAIPILERHIADNGSEVSRAWALWSRCAFALGKPQLVHPAIDRALACDPLNAEAHYLSAWWANSYWDYQAGYKAALAGLSIEPDSSSLQTELAKASTGLRRHSATPWSDSNGTEIEDTASANFDDPAALLAMARLHRDDNELKKATLLVDRSLVLDPSNALALRERADLAYLAHDGKFAGELYLSAIRAKPSLVPSIQQSLAWGMTYPRSIVWPLVISGILAMILLLAQPVAGFVMFGIAAAQIVRLHTFETRLKKHLPAALTDGLEAVRRAS